MNPTQPQEGISEEQQITLDLLGIFHRRIVLASNSAIGSNLWTSFFIWYFSLVENITHVLIWPALTGGIFCIGYFLKYYFDRHPATISSAKRWQLIFAAYSWICGTGWGVGCAYMCWYPIGINIAMIAAILICVCCTGVSLVTSQSYAASLFVIGAMLPPAICMLLKATSLEILVGLLLLLGLSLMLAVIHVMHRSLCQQLRTQIRLNRAVNDAQQARAQAIQANSFKNQFLANVSHEIRTPMNAVLGMLKLLQYTHLDERQSDYTLKGESAAKAMLGLLNDILDFSKIESGKVVLDIQPLHLSEFMQELMTVLQAYAGQKPIQLCLALAPELPQAVLGDPLRLRQILMNLGGNAIKFTEHGQVTLRVLQINQKENIATLRFEVQDNGIGIALEKQNQIFEEFTQAENSTTRRFGGTGLGLSISKQLIEAMGGTIYVQSAPDQGSTFLFELRMQVIRWSPKILEDIEEIYRTLPRPQFLQK